MRKKHVTKHEVALKAEGIGINTSNLGWKKKKKKKMSAKFKNTRISEHQKETLEVQINKF